MILSDKQIQEARESRDLEIIDFKESCLQGASYDLRIGSEILKSGDEHVTDLKKTGSFTIPHGDFAILTTLERIKCSNSIAGRIGVKSYYTRKGLVFLSGLQIDPGFDGVLALGVYNAAPRKMTIEYGDPFCSVEFHRLSVPAEISYDTDSDLHAGHLPRADKEYLRNLETETLTDLSNAVRELTKDVGSMQENMKRYIIPMLVGLYIVIFGLFLTQLVLG